MITHTGTDPMHVVIAGGGVAITDVCPWDSPAKIAAKHLGPYLADGKRYAVRA